MMDSRNIGTMLWLVKYYEKIQSEMKIFLAIGNSMWYKCYNINEQTRSLHIVNFLVQNNKNFVKRTFIV